MKLKGILSVVLLAVLLGCSGTGNDNMTVGKKALKKSPLLTNLHVCLERPYFTSFLPYQLAFLNDTHIYTLLYNTLVTTDHSGRLAPELAERWSVSDDSREYRFKLKKKIFFHNGKRLSINDVFFSIRELVFHNHDKYPELTYIEGADAFINGKTKHISGLVRTGPHSFSIKLKKSFKYFLHLLSSGMTAILPEFYCGKSREEFNERPVGTGPFRFESRAEVTVGNYSFLEFRFVRNPIYFMEIGNIGQLTLSMPVNGVEIEELMRFDIFFRDLENENAPILADRRIINGPYDIAVYLAFNPVENKAVKNRVFRQLANYSINREELVKFKNAGKQIPAHTLYPVNLFGHAPHYRVTYEKAGKLVKRLPKNNKGFTLQVYPGIRPEAEFIKKQLAKHDIGVSILEVPDKEYKKKISKPGQSKYSMILRGSADYPTPYNLLIQLYGRGGALNSHNVSSNDIMDRVLQLPLSDIKEEAKMLRTIDNISEKESYYIPLYFLSNTLVMKRKVKNIAFKYPGIINYSRIEVNDE